MTLAERIKEIRGKLKQEEFAEKIGVHVSTLRSYEAGSVPKGDVLERIHFVTGASIDWLLFEEGEIHASERKSSDISTPSRPGAAEGGAGYGGQPERMLAGGELVDVTLIEAAEDAKTISRLVRMLEKKDREIEELRRKVADLERRLAATEGDADRRAEEKTGSGGGE